MSRQRYADKWVPRPFLLRRQLIQPPLVERSVDQAQLNGAFRRSASHTVNNELRELDRPRAEEQEQAVPTAHQFVARAPDNGCGRRPR
jgi:hypothetical protein